jgi:hypothetical protein
MYRVKPIAFYVPTKHEYVRYGPWILDYRRDETTAYGSLTVNYGGKQNRSNYGKTTVVLDNDLNPWEFKSYGEIQNYIIEQNKNYLLTEYRLNRGQITCEDIPRFNIGHAIGRFSNISNIGINYDGDGGVKTTYTLSAFGVGETSKQQRETQKVYNRLRNIEERIQDDIPLITESDLNTLLGRKK